jgi:hypothetical protein
VVERTDSWLNRFRRRFVRWEKKPENHLAMLHIACAFIAFRAARILGKALSEKSTELRGRWLRRLGTAQGDAMTIRVWARPPNLFGVEDSPRGNHLPG